MTLKMTFCPAEAPWMVRGANPVPREKASAQGKTREGARLHRKVKPHAMARVERVGLDMQVVLQPAQQHRHAQPRPGTLWSGFALCARHLADEASLSEIAGLEARIKP